MKTETENPERATPAPASPANRAGATRWAGGVASVLSAASAIVCPACIPAITSLLSALGLGFAVRPSFLNPAVIALLAISVGSLAWAARRHHRWWVLLIGIAGAILITISRFVVFVPAVMWIGAATLIGASVINFFIERTSCCQCRQDQNAQAAVQS